LSRVFFYLNLVVNFEKMMQFDSFFVKFFESNQDFFIKTKDGLFCWCNWHNHNVNFDEKSLLHFTKFNEIIKLHQFLKIRDQIETKKNRGPIWHLKKMNQKSNLINILAPPKFWFKIRHWVLLNSIVSFFP